ncbi:hypothetical protein HD806DRAFT_529702 [Xylariaceae sp. AK1471]|nr:hypothetical protein HD806DRAFT_529702 [Xylariaceae sp. AK1471]
MAVSQPSTSKEKTTFVCDKGHVHSYPLGGAGLLIYRKRKYTPSWELLVTKKFDLSKPEPPSWYATPNTSRLCEEPVEKCIQRALDIETGLGPEYFDFVDDYYEQEDGPTESFLVLATPKKSLGSRVGHRHGPDYIWILLSDVESLEIFPGSTLNNEDVTTIVASASKPDKKGVLSTLKRAFTLKQGRPMDNSTTLKQKYTLQIRVAPSIND